MRSLLGRCKGFDLPRVWSCLCMLQLRPEVKQMQPIRFHELKFQSSIQTTHTFRDLLRLASLRPSVICIVSCLQPEASRPCGPDALSFFLWSFAFHCYKVTRVSFKRPLQKGLSQKEQPRPDRIQPTIEEGFCRAKHL